ncbi:MAG: 2-amino-4-hydroxy-6-hydroxymethyldihydropteridine diphosphokinase [Planctomycetaceae bacterium]|nr:2-amino-4-hydroxy-6-hydroxymethyldihydropteridine diphosphokinase [Planctomycetaceae bacterium]
MSEHQADNPDKRTEAFVAVGSNIEPRENIPKALRLLSESVLIADISTFYRNPAWDRPRQSDYINGVIKIATSYDARALKFDVLRRIEAELGRVRTADKYAARTIDLDLILYGDLSIDEADLKLPDDNIAKRPFIALPLLELVPGLVLPGTRTALARMKIASEPNTMHPEPELTDALKARFFK